MRERRGRAAEGRAALYLRLKGWRILAFVEVKWRSSAELLDQAIDAHRLRRVAAAAQAVMADYMQGAQRVRIDVLLLAPWRFPRHIANAWQP
jgi:putative endonuclease